MTEEGRLTRGNRNNGVGQMMKVGKEVMKERGMADGGWR